MWYISTAVCSVVYIANHTGICTSCGKQPPNGFTPFFRQSSIIAKIFLLRVVFVLRVDDVDLGLQLSHPDRALQRFVREREERDAQRDRHQDDRHVPNSPTTLLWMKTIKPTRYFATGEKNPRLIRSPSPRSAAACANKSRSFGPKYAICL